MFEIVVIVMLLFHADNTITPQAVIANGIMSDEQCAQAGNFMSDHFKQLDATVVRVTYSCEDYVIDADEKSEPSTDKGA